MKRRWSVLFWSALASLIGLSWLANSFGISVMALLSASLVGMVAATGVAFFAMIKNVRAKWPAAVALVCAGPMVLDVLQALPDIGLVVGFFGPSYVIIVAGTIATAFTAIRTLIQPLPDPPPPPPVAPARVVD